MPINALLPNNANQDQILVAIRDRLIAKIPACTDKTCYVTDQPVPDTFPQGHTCVTVSAGSGSFDQSRFSGGGWNQLRESCSVIVTPFNRLVNRSRPNQPIEPLFDAEYGLIKFWKKRILRALLIDNETLGKRSGAWEPAIGERSLVTEMLFPLDCQQAMAVSSADRNDWYGIQIRFRATWDWDLLSD